MSYGLILHMNDELAKIILTTINRTRHPLTSTEVYERIQKKTTSRISRIQIVKRLEMLEKDKEINGKKIGPGLGTWVWYKREKRRR